VELLQPFGDRFVGCIDPAAALVLQLVDNGSTELEDQLVGKQDIDRRADAGDVRDACVACVAYEGPTTAAPAPTMSPV
jgi:hypothetical protein